MLTYILENTTLMYKAPKVSSRGMAEDITGTSMHVSVARTLKYFRMRPLRIILRDKL